jgi:hypothetical protein
MRVSALGVGGIVAAAAAAVAAVGLAAGAPAPAAPLAHDGAGVTIAYAPPPPPPRLPPPTGEKLEVMSPASEPAPVSADLAQAENANLMRRMEAQADREAAAQTAEMRRQDVALSRELRALEAPPPPEPAEDADSEADDPDAD